MCGVLASDMTRPLRSVERGIELILTLNRRRPNQLSTRSRLDRVSGWSCSLPAIAFLRSVVEEPVGPV